MGRTFLRLKLDLTAFDEEPFLPGMDRCLQGGIRPETLCSLGNAPENRVRLYEFNKECSADIPGRGAFYGFSDYVSARLERPSDDPAGIMVALHEERWVGMTATSLWEPDRSAFCEMTGVVREYRRRKIALSLKILAIRFAKARGAKWMLTLHDSENVAPLHLNFALGFRETRRDDPLFSRFQHLG